MTVYAIGATSLTGGGAGALDAVYAGGIENGRPAVVFIQGDAVSHYMADAASGAAADGVNVIVPLWESAGVPYTGDLRWILHNIDGGSF